jgi:DNA topoisomerase-1
VEAYCVKCKQKRNMIDPEPTFTANGAPATRGVCEVCGTRLFRMGRTPAHQGLQPPVVESRPRESNHNNRTPGGSARKRSGRLVIVESPAKARTVGRFLGKGFKVRASVGHVRDLLRSKLSVDVDNDFEPVYRVPNEKRDVVKALKVDVSKAKDVFLATDPDREGEAIAWHLMQAAEIEPQQAQRVVFHEITKTAIERAFAHPRSIDMDLVDAQQARRIVDRLVGYNLSPLLWSKVRSRLSAGRVQSAALRLVVDREREIQDFVPQEYWTIDAEFIAPGKPPAFRAKLMQIDGAEVKPESEDAVRPIVKDMRSAGYRVASVKTGVRTRRPSAPYTTSTLQQDASRRLAFSARKVMAVAQQLYEGVELDHTETVGLITYMRTDSTQVSTEAQSEARQLIRSRYGAECLPDSPPVYQTKTRGAQEAHEAIRPTSVAILPDDVRHSLSGDQLKLYTLIWNRFIASQMSPAEYDTLTVEIEGRSAAHEYALRVSASSLRFAGFLQVMGEAPGENGDDNGVAENGSQLDQLPALAEGDLLDLLEVYPDQHFTQPPARYSEAGLVRALEENGIGRPSTYAPIITTIQQRGYVRREKRRLIPTEIGEIVNDLIVDHFPEIVDLGFTAKMEEELDDIAEGKREWVDVIRAFYDPFAEQVRLAGENMPEMKPENEPLGRTCPEDGGQLLIRHGRYGRFIGCSNFPTCRYTEPWLEKIGVRCPQDGGELVERHTRRGRIFYGCANYPDCDFTSWKRPLPTPCPNCGGLLVAENKKKTECQSCHTQFDRNEIPEVERDLA